MQTVVSFFLRAAQACRQAAQQKEAQRTQEEEAAALRVAETIKAKVQEVMASEATQQRVQRRLKEERASLEDKVNFSAVMLAVTCILLNTSLPAITCTLLSNETK